MTVTATGPITIPLQRLAQLVAASATFQGICEAANATAALAFVHWPEASDAVIVSPRAIVRFGPSWTSERFGHGTHERSGELELSFECPLPDLDEEEDTEANQLASFANDIGAILVEMEALAGQGDAGNGKSHLNVVNIAQTAPPGKCNPQREGGNNYFAASFLVTWRG